MSDYISREAAKQILSTLMVKDAAECACNLIDSVLPADVEPVRRGRWELHGNDDDVSASYFCSLCGYNFDEDEFLDRWSHIRYCPNCGAKMDLEDEINDRKAT